VSTTEEIAPPDRKTALIRFGILAAVLIGLYVAGKLTGVLDRVDVTTLRAAVQDAGAWGFALFVALFAVGVTVQVPGAFFVAAAILAYGKTIGYAAALSGSVVAVCVSFAMVRVVGGRALTSIRRPFIRRILARLDENPIRWLVVLRIIMFVSPPLNYALALSNMKFRDYAIGSTIGLTIAMAAWTMGFDWLFNHPTISAFLFR
jgi:uncharacterized membrane protein YdjX (TVP38/TMEM64 family)